MKQFLLGFFVIVSTASATISLTPRSLDFGTTYLPGGYSSSRNVWVRNTGGEDVGVDVSQGTCFSEYRITDTCHWTLRPGESCRVQVEFRPYREGLFSCSMNIQDSEYSRQSVRIYGRAVRRR